MRNRIAALAVVFLALHLPFLPPTLEDIDSVNFALGVREFDVATHQPHPPGYPVFIALGKLSTAIVAALGVPAPEPRALALLGVVCGTLTVPLLFAFFRRVDADLALWTTVLTVCSPLFWFTALRPLSDMTGLAAAGAAHALLLPVIWPAPRERRTHAPGELSLDRRRFPFDGPGGLLIAGGLVAGLAAGVRVQTVMLTAPLLIAALCWPRADLGVRQRGAAVAAALVGVAAWLVPLVAASGGLEAYAAALGTQAGEDFHGVAMLWTTRHPRALADALLYTFVWPWGSLIAGGVAVLLAGAGCVRAALRAPRVLVLLAGAFGPYAVFHLLFQETITQRYALPLVSPAAFLILYALRAIGPATPAVAAAALASFSLVLALPAAHAYARDGSPAFRAFAAELVHGSPGGDVIAMHAVARRVEEWYRPLHRARALEARHGREWLALVEHWRAEPQSGVRFLADPRRTDLTLFDPQARHRATSARWTFPEFPFVAGVRPGAADAYVMRPPGWMLGTGWALTAEVGGVTAAMHLGPHIRPSVAWVRARDDRSTLLVGGRHMGAGAAPVRLTMATEDREIAAWDVGPGAFVHRIELAAGVLSGTGYIPVFVSAGVPGTVHAPPVSLEQFDLQSDGVPMLGLLDGWHEPEYNPATGRSWRWMSERVHLWIRPMGRDVTLTLGGESPLRYFDREPEVRLTAAGQELTRFSPRDDFEQEIAVPAAIVAAADGLITIETDRWFTPADRDGAADRRHLALRIYSIRVR